MNTKHKNDIEKNEIIENCLISLANGDISLLKILYSIIKTDIYAFALSKVCCSYDAEDIMQDTFLQIYKTAKQYVPNGKPMAWIITIETNIINRYFQLKKRSINLDESHQQLLVDEKLKDNKINDEFLLKLLSTLTEEEREIISLHIVSELKFREIAKRLSKPLSTVLSKYNRAIKKLNKIAKEEDK